LNNDCRAKSLNVLSPCHLEYPNRNGHRGRNRQRPVPPTQVPAKKKQHDREKAKEKNALLIEGSAGYEEGQQKHGNANRLRACQQDTNFNKEKDEEVVAQMVGVTHETIHSICIQT